MGEIEEIVVETVNGIRAVQAEIIGQLAVHDALEAEQWYVVTHIESGRAVIHFTARHVAVNFAKRMNERYDFMRFFEDEDYQREVAEAIRLAHFHPSAIYVDALYGIVERMKYGTHADVERFHHRIKQKIALRKAQRN